MDYLFQGQPWGSAREFSLGVKLRGQPKGQPKGSDLMAPGAGVGGSLGDEPCGKPRVYAFVVRPEGNSGIIQGESLKNAWCS